MPEDDEYLRKFAAQIAMALREKEDASAKQQQQSQLRIDKCVDELYRSLVFDEPLLDHIPNLAIVSSALSRQLLVSKATSLYALSNRLVNGIVYLCNQNQKEIQEKKRDHVKRNDKNDEGNNNNEVTTTAARAITFSEKDDDIVQKPAARTILSSVGNGNTSVKNVTDSSGDVTMRSTSAQMTKTNMENPKAKKHRNSYIYILSSDSDDSD